MQTSLSPTQLLQHQKQQHQRLYSQFVLSLDKATMNKIKLQFQNQLSLLEFSQLIKKYTAWWNSTLANRQYFVQKFIEELFYNTMYCGATIIQYQEFTKYVIRKMTVLKTIKAETWQIPYVAHHKTIDNYYHINKMLYLPFAKAICFFQQDSNIIYFFDSIKFQPVFKPIIVGKRKREKKNELYSKQEITTNTILLNMILIEIEDTHILLTSTNDRKIRGWSLGPVTFQQAYYPHNRHDDIVQKFSSEVYTMCWDPVNEIVYCGFKNGSICLWKICMNVVKPIPLEHNSMIMCMIALPRLYMLATGGIDGKVVLWNISTEQKKWVYKQHTRGVLTLAYDEGSSLLFSAGFDHQICIWNPYTNQLTNKLQIHQQPVISLCMGYNHSLISLDSMGIVKITSMKKWNTLISYHTDSIEPAGIVYLENVDKVALFGEKVKIFDYETNHNPNLTDNNISICSLLLSNSEVITISGNLIKVWSLYIGTATRTVQVPNIEGISSISKFQDGLIIGDTKGALLFARINDQPPTYKYLPQHSSEINSIKVVPPTQFEETKRIIVGSTQLHLLSYSNNNFSILSAIVIERCEATALEYHLESRSILVGTNAGSILIFSEKLMMRSHINLSSSMVCGIKFVDESLMGVAFDNRVDLIEITQNVIENKVVLTKETRLRVLAMDVSKDGRIFVGLEKGILQCYKVKQNQNKMMLAYQAKAHQDDIIHILCLQQYGIVITSSTDKAVKIFSMETGKLIDQFKQDIERIMKWKQMRKKEKEEKEEKIWLEKLKKECLRGLTGPISDREREKEKMNWNLTLDWKEEREGLVRCLKIKCKKQELVDEIVEQEKQKQNRLKSDKELDQKSEEIQNQIRTLMQRSLSTHTNKPPQQIKIAPLSIKKSISLHSSIKTRAEQRNISQQSLHRISVHAKRSFSNELTRMQKHRTFSLKPKTSQAPVDHVNKQNQLMFKLPSRMNTKALIMSKCIGFSRQVFPYPTKTIQPVGNKLSKMIR